MEAIKVLLAGQQALIAAGLKYFIAEQEDLAYIGEATNKEDLLLQLEALQAQLLIISYETLPDFQISDFFNIRKAAPSVHILAIASKLERNDILQVTEAGVTGFLTGECSYNEIISAIRTTARGEKFFCGKILDLLMEKRNSPSEPAGQEQLTEREIQIIRCITEGQSTKEIADTLNLSMHTINAYRKSILQKMDVRSPAELAVRAIKAGIIEI